MADPITQTWYNYQSYTSSLMKIYQKCMDTKKNLNTNYIKIIDDFIIWKSRRFDITGGIKRNKERIYWDLEIYSLQQIILL